MQKITLTQTSISPALRKKFLFIMEPQALFHLCKKRKKTEKDFLKFCKTRSKHITFLHHGEAFCGVLYYLFHISRNSSRILKMRK